MVYVVLFWIVDGWSYRLWQVHRRHLLQLQLTWSRQDYRSLHARDRRHILDCWTVAGKFCTKRAFRLSGKEHQVFCIIHISGHCLLSFLIFETGCVFVTLLTDMETKYQNLKMAVAFLHASECKTTASNFGCNAVTYVNAVVQILSVCLCHCHMPIWYQSGWTCRQSFLAVHHSIFTC